MLVINHVIVIICLADHLLSFLLKIEYKFQGIQIDNKLEIEKTLLV